MVILNRLAQGEMSRRQELHEVLEARERDPSEEQSFLGKLAALELAP